MKDRFQPGDQIKGRGLIGMHVWTVFALITPKSSMSEYKPYYVIQREDKSGEVKKPLSVDAAENYDKITEV